MNANTLLRVVLLIQVLFALYAIIRRIIAGSVCWGWTFVHIAYGLKSVVIALFILSIWDEPDRVGIITLAAFAYGLGDIGQLMIINRVSSTSFGNQIRVGLGLSKRNS